MLVCGVQKDFNEWVRDKAPRRCSTDDLRVGRGNLRVGSGPSTGNIDNSVPNTKKVIATQAIGIESLSPV